MNIRSSLYIVLASLVLGVRSYAVVNVVTTDPTLAWITGEVGGVRVHVESLSRGVDDPHQVEPRPSMVVKLAHAQVFARIGMDLDIWANGPLTKSGNAQIQPGGKGYADCSDNLKRMEIPPAKLDPSMGDIHIYGNPHYLLDPANGILAAGNIAAALIRVDPAGYSSYHDNFITFGNKVKEKLKSWHATLAPYKGSPVTTYHRSWVYFMARFGLKEFGTIEPRPGIPPSPGHIKTLAEGMKADNVHAMLVEDFRSHRFPDLLAGQTGAKVVYVPLSVEGEPGIDNYFQLFDTIVNRLAVGLK